MGAEWPTGPLAVCSPSARRWRCILNLQGYEVYCPRLRELRVLRGRRVEVLLPLFPGYTFLQVVTGWWQARWAPGTRGLVMDGTTPAKVPDAVIAEIRSREDEGAIELPPKVRPGDRVRVLRGPFRDHLAIYAGMTGRTGSLSCSGCSVSAGSFCPDAISRANGRVGQFQLCYSPRVTERLRRRRSWEGLPTS